MIRVTDTEPAEAPRARDGARRHAGGPAAASMGSRILLLQLYEYHLFQYVPDLVRELAGRGHEVTVMSTDPAVVERYGNFGERVSGAFFPRILRMAMGRDNRPLFRAIEWLVAWPWSRGLRRRFDCVVATRTNRPAFHAAITALPAVYPQPALSTLEKHFLIRDARPDDASLHRRLKESMGPRRMLRDLVDRLFGLGFDHTGFARSPNLHVCACGPKMAEYFTRHGIPAGRTTVTGNPAFQFLGQISDEDPGRLRQEFAPGHDGPVVLVLPGHLRNDAQKAQFRAMLAALDQNLRAALFLFKTHPNATRVEVEMLRDFVAEIGLDFRILGGARDNLNLTRAIRASDIVLLSRSGLAFLGMLLNRVVINYRDSPDSQVIDFYEYLPGIANVRNADDMAALARRLGDPSERARIAETQLRLACDICSPARSPVDGIADVIDRVCRTGQRSPA